MVTRRSSDLRHNNCGIVNPIEPQTIFGDGTYGVAVTADGRGAVSASSDQTLKVWDLETGREVRTAAK